MTFSPTIYLHEFYGARFGKLSAEEQRLLTLDVLGIMEEEHIWARNAVALLDQRIEGKLEPYVASLVAGANRRKKT